MSQKHINSPGAMRKTRKFLPSVTSRPAWTHDGADEREVLETGVYIVKAKAPGRQKASLMEQLIRETNAASTQQLDNFVPPGAKEIVSPIYRNSMTKKKRRKKKASGLKIVKNEQEANASKIHSNPAISQAALSSVSPASNVNESLKPSNVSPRSPINLVDVKRKYPSHIPIPMPFFCRGLSLLPKDKLDFSNWGKVVNNDVLKFVRDFNTQHLTYLSLERSVNIKTKSLNRLLSLCRKLVMLNLSHTRCTTNETLHTISSACKHLQHLDISFCPNVSGVGIARLGEGICAESLVTLNCSGSNVSTNGDGGAYVFQLISKGCPKMENLLFKNAKNILPRSLAKSMKRPRNLMDRTITAMTLVQLKAADFGDLNDAICDDDLFTLVCERVKIESLDLRGCESLTDDGIRAFAQKKTAWGHISHKGYPFLKTLVLSKCKLLTDVALSWCQAGCPRIEFLEISNCPKIGDWGLRSMSTMEHFKVLRCKCCEMITAEGLKMLLFDERNKPTPASRTIQEIDVTGCFLVQTNTAMVLCAKASPLLTKLALNYCSISDPVLDATFSALSHGCRHLQSLQLARKTKKQKRAGHVESFTSMPSLAEEAKAYTTNGIYAKKNKRSIMSFGPAYPSETAIEFLAEHLNKSLTELDCSYCPDLSASALKVLQSMRTLRFLHFAGCRRIADSALQYMPTWKLKKLTLASNPQLTDNGIIHLAKCSELEELNVAFCINISDVGLLSLCLDYLPSLRVLNVYGCDYVTKEGSLDRIICEKPTAFHIEYLHRKVRRQDRKIGSFGFRGFSPAENCVEKEVQRSFRETMVRQNARARQIQRAFRAFFTRVIFIRKSRAEKARKMFASSQIQRIYRGYRLRKKLKVELYYKKLVAVRLEYCYRVKRAKRNRRKALGFFKHRELSKAMNQWKYKVDEIIRLRGEISAQEYMKRAWLNYTYELKKKVFSGWTVYTWMSARRGRQIQKALAYFNSNTESKYFQRWRILVDEAKQYRSLRHGIWMAAVPLSYWQRSTLMAMKVKAIENHRKILQKEFFDIWNLRCLEQRQYLRMRARRVYKTWCVVVLRNWHMVAKKLGVEKRKFRKILAKMQRSKELRVLLAWREYSIDAKHSRRALAHLINGTSIRIINGWRKFVKLQQTERAKLEHAALMWKNIGKSKAVKQWYNFILEKRHYKRMILKALNMMRNKMLFQFTSMWKQKVIDKRNMQKRALAMFKNRLLWKCFQALAKEAGGRLERIKAATLIQKRWRGKMQYDLYNKDRLEKLWATEKIQAAFRGRRGRKKWTKKRRRKDLYQAIKEEKETDEMEKEDKLAFEIRRHRLAAEMVQKRWRGKKARMDFVFYKIACSRDKGLLYMEQQREARELARERQKARDELNNLKWLCATRIQLWWRGPIQGRLFLHKLKLEKKKNACALKLQSAYRGRLGRHTAMAKRRLKSQFKTASVWRKNQGWVMRSFGLKHRHQQRFAYYFLSKIGLQPIEFNVVARAQLREIYRDYQVFRKKLAVEFEVLKTAIEKKTFKWSKSIRQKGEIQIAEWQGDIVHPHMACRIIMHRDKELIGHTGYILNIDMSRGSHGMCEIKLDMDGSLRYVPVMYDGDATVNEMRGVIRTPPLEFKSMPKKITKQWRQALRLLAEVEVKNGIQYRAARKIQRWVRQIFAISHVIDKMLLDKKRELRRRANTYDFLHRFRIKQNSRTRFILANSFLFYGFLRYGGWGNKKYKYYPEMPIRPFVPLGLYEWNTHRKRRASVSKEIGMIIQKRRAEVIIERKEHRDTEVRPFVRNTIWRNYRQYKHRKIKKKEAKMIKIINKEKALKQERKAKLNLKYEMFERVGDAANAAGVEWKTMAKKKKKQRKQELDEDSIRKIFETFDTDGSGEIDKDELQVLGYALGEIWDSDLVDAIMLDIDKDGSGAIDFKEFLDWFSKGGELNNDRGSNALDPDEKVNVSMSLRLKLQRRILLGKLNSWFRKAISSLPKSLNSSIRSRKSEKPTNSSIRREERGTINYISVSGGIASCHHDGVISSIAPGDMITVRGNHETTEGEQVVIATLDSLTFTFQVDDGAVDTDDPHYQRGFITKVTEAQSESQIVDISVSYGIARLTYKGVIHVQKGTKIEIEKSSGEIFNGVHTVEDRLNSNTLSFKTEAEDTHDQPHTGGIVKVHASAEKKRVKFDDNNELEEEVEENSTNKNLKMNIAIKNRRDHLQWAGVWHFKQLHISKYVPGEGYCLVHGEWDRIKKLPVTKKILKENPNSMETRSYNALKAAHRAAAAEEDGVLEEMEDAIRVAEMELKDENLAGYALMLQKFKRFLLKRRLRLHRNKMKRAEKQKERKYFMPHGAGVAIFPIHRDGFSIPGKDNTDDFGKLAVGEVCLNHLDIRDLTYSHGLLQSFKETLASEIAHALRISYYRVHIFDVDDATIYDSHYYEKEIVKTVSVRESFRRGMPYKYTRYLTDSMRKEYLKEQEEVKASMEKKMAEEELTKTDFQRKVDFAKKWILEKYTMADTFITKRTGRFETKPPDQVQIVASALRSRVKVRFHILPPKNGMNEPRLDEVCFDLKRQALVKKSRIKRTKIYAYRLVPMSLRIQSIGGHGSVGHLSYSATDKFGFAAGIGVVKAHDALTVVENEIRRDDIDKERLKREKKQRELSTAVTAASLQRAVNLEAVKHEEKLKKELAERSKLFENAEEAQSHDDDNEVQDPEVKEGTVDTKSIDKLEKKEVESLSDDKTIVSATKGIAEAKLDEINNANVKSDETKDDEGNAIVKVKKRTTVFGQKNLNWTKLRRRVKNTNEQNDKIYMDYRKSKMRRHIRTYWPQIHHLEGIFHHGIISGNVFILFHDKSKYSGPWVDALESRAIEHVGTWTTPENISYNGEKVDNHFDVSHATGENFTIKYPNGDIYLGPLLDGKRQGWAICKYGTGASYHGQWWQDRRHGMGRYFVPDETLGGTSEYNGPWRHDKKHGFGTETFPDGSTYEGSFFQDLWHGDGVRYFANGDVYTGAFQNGKMWGKGTLVYHDGRQYTGDMWRDLRHGFGVLLYPRVNVKKKGQRKAISGSVAQTNSSRGPGVTKDPDENPLKPETRTADRYNRGVLAFRGDWGPIGAERYEGPFKDGHEHGQALWVVPREDMSEERRYGVWENGERLKWLTVPVNREQSAGFVEMFADPLSFRGIQAAMIARFLPHLPPGVDGADPAVKLMCNGILRNNASIAGEAIIIEHKSKLEILRKERDEAEEKKFYCQDILEDATEVLEQQLEVVQAIRDNEKDLHHEIWQEEKLIKEHWDRQPKDYLGRYHRSVDWINRIQLKSWHKARAVLKPRPPVHLVYEAICIMLNKEKTQEEAIKILNDRKLNVKAGDRESIMREYDVKLKDILARDEFSFYQLNEKQGEKGATFRSVWLLKPYVENIEFRSDNSKLEMVADALCAITEWVIAAYKCAVYAIPVMKHRKIIKKLEHEAFYLKKDLSEEELELGHLRREYEQAFNDYNTAETKHTQLKLGVEKLENTIRVIHRMRKSERIPDEARTWALPNLRSREPYQAKSTDVTLALQEINENNERKLQEKG